MAFDPIQNFFPAAAQNLGFSKTFTSIQICHGFQKILPKMVSTPESILNISAKSYSEKTLTVAVSSPLWAQEVTMRKEEIIRQMNADFGDEVIKKLKIELT
jgi:hypothetical protein